MPNRILFLAHGSEAVLQECAFALLSLTAFGGDIADLEIWVYTDKPSWFGQFRDLDLPINFRSLSSAELQAWRGPHDYVHRIKTAALLDFTTRHPGALLFLDTDVQLLSGVAPLFRSIASGRQFMHMREGGLSDADNSPIVRKTARFFRAHRATIFDGKTLPSARQFSLWNSGVIGYQADDGAVMTETLQWVDALHPHYRRHITEQLAVSIVLGSRGSIYKAAPYVLHYWSAKEVRPILTSFFNHYRTRRWSELVRLSRMISLPVYMQEKTSFFINRSIAGKVAKAKWTPRIPDWDEEEKLLG